MKTSIIAAVALVLACAGLTGSAVAQNVELRRIDRATVRVIGVGGARTARIRGQHTGTTRLPALPDARHGTGVVIDADGLVVTARHVVQGIDVAAVVRPGESSGIPAQLVFVHPERDLAVLKMQGPVDDFLPLPEQSPSLRTSQQVFASGYPIDHRERFPAAVSGVISRENNDGALQLAMAVNPGNSGGPVVDAEEALVGILVARGDPEAGVESIALIEPLRHVREAAARAEATLARAPARFDEQDRWIAQVVTDYVRTSDEHPLWEQTSVATIERAASATETPEEAAVVASHAWNMSLALLEDRRQTDASRLRGEDRAMAQRLLELSLSLARRIDARAPYVRLHYPVVRSILVSNGRPFVP